MCFHVLFGCGAKPFGHALLLCACACSMLHPELDVFDCKKDNKMGTLSVLKDKNEKTKKVILTGFKKLKKRKIMKSKILVPFRVDPLVISWLQDWEFTYVRLALSREYMI